LWAQGYLPVCPLPYLSYGHEHPFSSGLSSGRRSTNPCHSNSPRAGTPLASRLPPFPSSRTPQVDSSFLFPALVVVLLMAMGFYTRSSPPPDSISSLLEPRSPAFWFRSVFHVRLVSIWLFCFALLSLRDRPQLLPASLSVFVYISVSFGNYKRHLYVHLFTTYSSLPFLPRFFLYCGTYLIPTSCPPRAHFLLSLFCAISFFSCFGIYSSLVSCFMFTITNHDHAIFLSLWTMKNCI